jgi:hypothetical protein
MGFNFLSEEQRNPTPFLSSEEELMLQKLMDSNDSVRAKLAELEEFIDENRLLQKFYAWQALREQMRDTGAEVIEE